MYHVDIGRGLVVFVLFAFVIGAGLGIGVYELVGWLCTHVQIGWQ